MIGLVPRETHKKDYPGFVSKEDPSDPQIRTFKLGI